MAPVASSGKRIHVPILIYCYCREEGGGDPSIFFFSNILSMSRREHIKKKWGIDCVLFSLRSLCKSFDTKFVFFTFLRFFTVRNIQIGIVVNTLYRSQTLHFFSLAGNRTPQRTRRVFLNETNSTVLLGSYSLSSMMKQLLLPLLLLPLHTTLYYTLKLQTTPDAHANTTAYRGIWSQGIRKLEQTVVKGSHHYAY